MGNEPNPANYQPIVKEIMSMVDTMPGWKEIFQKTMDNINALNLVDYQSRGLTSLDAMYKWWNDFVIWVPQENKFGHRVLEYLCMFFFFFDQEPVLSLQTPEKPAYPEPKLTPLSQWLKKYMIAQGEFLDTPESLTPATLKTFYDAPDYNMDEYVQPHGGWKTFNEWFARYTKPGYRPIAGQGDDTVIVAGAEATFSGQWEVNSGTKVNCKGLYWSIEELLEGTGYEDAFKGGMWTHSFLNTNDYHRQHAPVSGTVVYSGVLPGATYVKMTYGPDPENPGQNRLIAKDGSFEGRSKVRRTKIENDDLAGYEFMQQRGCIIIDNPVVGLVAILPIGMSNVSSIICTAEKGRTLRKGEEVSYFQFGGSDYVMVFQEKANISFTAQPGVHYKVGTRIAQAYPVVK